MCDSVKIVSKRNIINQCANKHYRFSFGVGLFSSSDAFPVQSLLEEKKMPRHIYGYAIAQNETEIF